MKRAWLLLILAACLQALPATQAPLSERAKKLHEQAFVFDGHIHVINRQFYLGGDIGLRVADGQIDLPRAREGGIDAMFFSVFVTEEYLCVVKTPWGSKFKQLRRTPEQTRMISIRGYDSIFHRSSHIPQRLLPFPALWSGEN